MYLKKFLSLQNCKIQTIYLNLKIGFVLMLKNKISTYVEYLDSFEDYFDEAFD